MKQTHETNIAFLKLKDKHGFSIASLAAFLHCSIDTIKGYTSRPETTRHKVVPLRQLNIFRDLLKAGKS